MKINGGMNKILNLEQTMTKINQTINDKITKNNL